MALFVLVTESFVSLCPIVHASCFTQELPVLSLFARFLYSDLEPLTEAGIAPDPHPEGPSSLPVEAPEDIRKELANARQMEGLKKAAVSRHLPRLAEVNQQDATAAPLYSRRAGRGVERTRLGLFSCLYAHAFASPESPFCAHGMKSALHGRTSVPPLPFVFLTLETCGCGRSRLRANPSWRRQGTLPRGRKLFCFARRKSLQHAYAMERPWHWRLTRNGRNRSRYHCI